jgi:hypothetical protein
MQILEPLLEGMSTPVVHCFPDGQFRRAIYGLGPYIADYPEQCLIASVVQMWCPMYSIIILLWHLFFLTC